MLNNIIIKKMEKWKKWKKWREYLINTSHRSVNDRTAQSEGERGTSNRKSNEQYGRKRTQVVKSQ